jgi:hypothetical protein
VPTRRRSDERSEFEQILRKLQQHLERVPVPIYDIATYLGFSVVRDPDLPASKLGATDPEHKLIILKDRLSAGQERGTLAHEIAHILTREHMPESDTWPKVILEGYVEELGFRILMPEPFSRVAMEQGLDLGRLATTYGVSRQAAAIRLAGAVRFPLQVAHFRYGACDWVTQTKSFSRNNAAYRKGGRLRAEQREVLVEVPSYGQVRECVISYERPKHTAIVLETVQEAWVVAFISGAAAQVTAYWNSKWRSERGSGVSPAGPAGSAGT